MVLDQDDDNEAIDDNEASFVNLDVSNEEWFSNLPAEEILHHKEHVLDPDTPNTATHSFSTVLNINGSHQSSLLPLCPPHGPVAHYLTLVLTTSSVFLSAWTILGPIAAPGGTVFALLVLIVRAEQQQQRGPAGEAAAGRPQCDQQWKWRQRELSSENICKFCTKF